MADDFGGYGDDSRPEKPDNEALARLNSLVDQAVEAEREALEAAEVAKLKADNHRRIITELIPSAMDELGLERIRTAGGLEVSVKTDITHSLAEERRELGMNWLDANGHGSVIKREVTMSFTKEQSELALAVAKELQSSHPDLPVGQRRNVAPSTLKALLRQLLEGGVDVPVDIFKVARVRKAVIS